MSVLFMDGFDHYQSPLGGFIQGGNIAGDILRKWTGTVFSTSGAVGPLYARGAGGGLALANATGIYKTLPASVATLTAGVAVYFTALPGGSYERLPCFLDNLTEQVYVNGDGSGHLTVVRGDGTVLATSTNVVSIGVWYYIELKATIHNTTGVIELRVNNSSTGWVPSTGSLNTRQSANNTANQVQLRSNLSTQFDDFYVCDTAGANSSFLGPCKIGLRAPAAAGNYAQWTGNPGPNFANVDDVPQPDGDMTFNQSATAGQIDSHVVQDVEESAGSIFAIQHVLYAKQDTGAQRTIAPFIRSGGSDFPGNNIALGTSYAYYLEVKETDPNTSAAWTVSGFNAAEFGAKMIS
jgi:hypothetical protein